MADFGGHESVSKICLLIQMFLFVYLNQTHLTDQQNYCVICLDRYILQEITHLSIMFDTLRQLIAKSCVLNFSEKKTLYCGQSSMVNGLIVDVEHRY